MDGNTMKYSRLTEFEILLGSCIAYPTGLLPVQSFGPKEASDTMNEPTILQVKI